MPLTTDEKRARRRARQPGYNEKYRAKKYQYFLDNREKYRQHSHQYYLEHRERLLAHECQRQKELQPQLRRKEAKAGRPRPDHCEVCGRNDRRIEFDHCHQRGVFRGWLCRNCNSALGHVNDNPNILRMLIAYLERTATIVPPQMSLPGI